MAFHKSPFRLFIIFSVLVLAVLACGSPKGETSALTVNAVLPTAPPQVGDTFELKLTLSNQSDYNEVVSEVRLPERLLASATLMKTLPELEAGVSDGYQTSFAYPRTIAPKGSETLTFVFKAGQEGDFSSDGTVVTEKGDVNFVFDLQVAKQTIEGFEPEPSTARPPIPLGPIPYQAVVQISALVEVDGEEIVGWTGSGTIISPDGLILTNAHVVNSDRFYTVKDLVVSLTVAQDSKPVETFLASVIQLDAKLDLAVIKIRANINGTPVSQADLNLPAVPLGNSDTLTLGDPIVILGYPGIGGDTITLTRGEVSGFTFEEAYGNRAFVKTSATIAGGNSGGLAVNERGELIGVPTQVGSGDIEAAFVDCRPLADTNRDGVIDVNDNCVPTGGFINALRPLKLALGLIEAAKLGQVAIEPGASRGEEYEPEGEVIFEDDFSNPNSGWYTSNTSKGIAAYEAGELTIEVMAPDYVIWSEVEYSLDEMVMVVDARVIQGVGDADFGFVCGIQDNDNFTVLEVSEDGYFSIWKYQAGEFISLVDWTYSDEVAAGGPYVMAAYCGSDGLALALDGVLLAEVVDPDFVPGNIGLLGGTFEKTGFKVGFDNFFLMQP